jgi:hypothetical protein
VKWLRWYIVLIVVLLGIYMYAAYKRPAQIDWRPTLSNRDKIPFGTYIVYSNLQSLFNQKPHEIREPVYDHTNNNEAEDEVYILIAGDIGTTETDENELLRYMSNGNTVFMSCEELSKSLLDTLKLEITTPAYFDIEKKDSTSLNFVNSFLKSKSDYKMLKNTVDAYFSKFDTARATVLGVNSNNQVNYLRMPIGKGYIYLHTAPIAFSNYFALKDKNIEYVEKALSYLPANPSAVYWDEYYKIGRGGATTPLRVILTKKDLRYAYFIALATILLFVIFQSKRRQRIIPVLDKPINATVDFVETVSRVYFNRKHHHNIATKKVTYLLEHIRNRYGLHTTGLDEDFQARLVQKSGASKELVSDLTSMVRYVRYGNEISEPELMKLNQLITNFYKNSSK